MSPSLTHILSRAGSISYHLRTLYLFTYTDYKTILVPVTCFALANAPLVERGRFLPALIWIWAHQLHINVSNQYKSMTEDMHNRPWRPLPSGRISDWEATALRYLLIPGCLILSIHISVDAAVASTWLAIAFFLYDDMGLAAHWYSKNMMNSLGYFGFEYGATRIMASTGFLRPEARLSLLTSPLIILTTVHAQDFSDIEGDKALRRCTLPVSFPNFSKALVCMGVPVWTFVLLHLWCLEVYPAMGLALLGMTVSLRFCTSRTPEEYASSYIIYNVWLLAVHSLPSIGHIYT